MNRRWLLGLVATALLCVPVQASAQAPRIERIEVLQSGLYNATVARREASPGTTSGRTSILQGFTFYAATTEVPARLGTRFGTEYRIVGSPNGQPVQLRSVVRIPEPGITNPVNGNTYRESVRVFTATIGATDITGYSFDQEWEILAGDWVQEIWADRRLLLSRTFTVRAP